jgi:hypothetical protein
MQKKTCTFLTQLLSTYDYGNEMFEKAVVGMVFLNVVVQRLQGDYGICPLRHPKGACSMTLRRTPH